MTGKLWRLVLGHVQPRPAAASCGVWRKNLEKQVCMRCGCQKLCMNQTLA